MAAKDLKVGDKRKAASGSKGKSDGKVKKARLNNSKPPKKATKKEADDFEDFTDSDDGGVKLDTKADNKAAKKTEGSTDAKEFDRTGLTSRESHAKQKQLAQERRAAKPLADEVQRTKRIWEKLRRKSHVPKEERQKLVEELFGIITGRCKDFVLKHDAVRAVQTAIKYSTPEQRKQIANELEGSYAQLAESRYAKFLIGKLLVQNDDEIRDLIIPNFYGKVRKLINHAEASWILDDISRTVATKEHKAILLREWYGPEFTLREMTRDTKPTADLKEILGNEPSKRGPIMKSLLDMINSLIQKKMTGFTMLHDAMLQYFVNTQPGTEEFNEFLELIKGDESGDLLKNMAFTKSGARLSCMLFAYGSSKDRKQLLKTYKDTFVLMSGDPYAHVIILTAYDVIDDTKLVAKSIFPELLGDKEEEVVQNVVGAVNNPNARTTILYLFEGLSKSLFPASHAFDLEVLAEVHEIRKTTSKKDEDLRRKELVAALSPQLLSVIAAAPSELTATAFGCQFVTDALLSEAEDKTKALEAIAQSAAGDPKEEPGEDELSSRPHISRASFGGRMLKSLIQGGKFDKATSKVVQIEPPLEFSNVLYPVIKEYVMDWATGPSSFVVVGMMEAGDFGEVDALKKTLKKNKKSLEKAVTEMTAEQKAAKEAQEEKASTEKGGKKGKKKTEPLVGNAGSKLLLEKL
ncbi:Pumilio homology domain family member 6 [Tolypocladium ophioglossoides CBS 100239]|uniref:Pumilio homology domain family member 6 n=1 Tax=Tolypocladium ophioglossoides (strain CBS 100239) TaxID=1163406 RepID=A0A0L0N868_TOLOC|nr:Pumilio homology domain family member 6 [Tolypocladium ophioglossoides CBS 100239]